MKVFTTLTGVAAPLYLPNIDTDTIIPSREITSVGREGLGEGAFAHWRYEPRTDRNEPRVRNPDFILNKAPYATATILLAGENFGCGSSREAAVWALEQLGIRAIIAPSFGSIFRANCYANGLLPIQLPTEVVQQLVNQSKEKSTPLTIDLHRCSVTASALGEWAFAIDAGIRTRLLEGLDEIGLTLTYAQDIASFQARDRTERPWIWFAKNKKGMNDMADDNMKQAGIPETIGLIGCGRMGIGLCRNLVRHGHKVMAYDIDPDNANAARKLGATVADGLGAIVTECQVILTCLPSLEAIKAVYEDVLLKACRADTLIIETSSAKPAMRTDYAKIAESRQIELVDAPMLRSAADAWEGTIQILLGGSASAVERARPVLESVCEKIIPAGPLGNAHIMKALNNAVTMTNHAILSEVFSVAEHIGLDGHTLLEMMRGSMAASYKLDDFVPKLLNDNHPRNAKIAFVEKDLSICHEVAKTSPVLTPVLDSACFTYRLACTMGGADEPPSKLGHVLRGKHLQ